MTPESTPPPIQPDGGSAPTPTPKKPRWLMWGCGGLLAFVLLVVATVAITVWWMQRPIKPVVLSEKEKAVVEQKIQKVGTAEDRSGNVAPRNTFSKPEPEPDRLFTPGSKELRLTERELNGLLNMNTELGQKVRLELARDAINAYLVIPIPQDFPIGGGKMFRARGRFRVSVGHGQAPYVILEDVTVLGLSLPKDWLGGFKGKNLLTDAVGERNGFPVIQGVKNLRIVSSHARGVP